MIYLPVDLPIVLLCIFQQKMDWCRLKQGMTLWNPLISASLVFLPTHTLCSYSFSYSYSYCSHSHFSFSLRLPSPGLSTDWWSLSFARRQDWVGSTGTIRVGVRGVRCPWFSCEVKGGERESPDSRFQRSREVEYGVLREGILRKRHTP